MKKLVLLILLILPIKGLSQRAQFCIFLPFEKPNKTLMPQMRMPLSWGFSFGYRPTFNLPLLIEFKSSFGSYATKSFSNNVPSGASIGYTKVNTIFKNRFNTYILGTKWVIGNEYRLIRPFFTPQIGIGNFNTLSKYNYNDVNGNTKTGRSSKNFCFNTVYGFEIGTEIIINQLFKNDDVQNQHRIALSFNLMRGFNSFEYTNIYNSFDKDNIANSTVTIKEDSYYVPISHKYLYQNYYTELYKTKLAMWGIQVGYIINFDGSAANADE